MKNAMNKTNYDRGTTVTLTSEPFSDSPYRMNTVMIEEPETIGTIISALEDPYPNNSNMICKMFRTGKHILFAP
jgi:hypothetical protein